MNYNELLNKMSNDMQAASEKAAIQKVQAKQTSTPKEDNTPILLNKIGLEIQRQGG